MRFLLLLLVLATLFGCAKAPDASSGTLPEVESVAATTTPEPVAIALPRWLSHNPCAAPCFEDSVVGQTSVDEALELLQGSALIRNIERGNFDEQQGYLDWTSDDYEAEAFYNHRTGNIEQISVNFEPHFSLQDVIELYGEPSHVQAAAMYSGHMVEGPAGEMISEAEYQLVVYYAPQGFQLNYRGDSEILRETMIDGDLLFQSVYFIAPNEITVVAEEPGFLEPDVLLRWQGFRDFAYYCRDRYVGEDVCPESN